MRRIRRVGSVILKTPASVLFEDWLAKKEVFLPVSQISRWGYDNEVFSGRVILEEVEEETMIWVEIPLWLARKEFLR